MKRTLSLFAAAALLLASAMPARATYYESALSLSEANRNLARSWYYTNIQSHYSDYYDYVDWGLIYNSWNHAVSARDQAWNAWWTAPAGSYAEEWALNSYYELAKLEQNLWVVYLYQGAYPNYARDAMVNAVDGQVYLSYAAEAATGHY